MKKALLLIVIVFFFSCCKKNETQQVKFNTKASLEQADKKAETDDRFVYNVKGVIYKKTQSNISNNCYFFIELESGKVFKWKVSEAKYYVKEVGDPVFFEYLLKSNFSDKGQ